MTDVGQERVPPEMRVTLAWQLFIFQVLHPDDEFRASPHRYIYITSTSFRNPIFGSLFSFHCCDCNHFLLSFRISKVRSQICSCIIKILVNESWFRWLSCGYCSSAKRLFPLPRSLIQCFFFFPKGIMQSLKKVHCAFLFRRWGWPYFKR